MNPRPSLDLRHLLRRAKNRVLYVFGDKNFPPAAGIQQSWFPKSFYERRNALLLFVKRSSSRADAVPGVFTSVGTRFYYSQNDLDSGSRADAGPGVSTSVGTRFYYSQNDLTARHSSWRFQECRNAASTICKMI